VLPGLIARRVVEILDCPGALERAQVLLHHRAIGFDRIQIYQNDSDDVTQKHLRTLQRAGAVEYFNNPSRNQTWQNKAYRRASQSDSYRDATWCMALDGDEFLHIKTGDGTLPDLVAACEGADEILVNWRYFGSGGHRDLSDRLVTERYTLCERSETVACLPRGVKSLFRTNAFRRPGIHRAKVPQVADPVVKNGSGLRLDNDRIVSWRICDPSLRSLAQVNHYAVRDASSFPLKTIRGSASHPDRDVSLKYWSILNLNDIEETDLQHMAARTREIMGELDAKSHGRLMHLREVSLKMWQEKLDAILRIPAYRQLYEALV
ncbi:MAG: glycosyltransferase family 2 protein, partial [Pseudomonadota bacterium]